MSRWQRFPCTATTGTATGTTPFIPRRPPRRQFQRPGPATRRRAGGHPQAMTLTEKTLVTIMRQHLGVPRAVLAELFGVAPNTIGTAERQVKPLLAQAGHTIEPATTPLTTLADLTAYATAQGITLTPKTKPAR
jgi:hypothetical protein